MYICVLSLEVIMRDRERENGDLEARRERELSLCA